ncbi:MAG: DUF6580 family putative transport protein [Deltaproteobacteria bacterium]
MKNTDSKSLILISIYFLIISLSKFIPHGENISAVGGLIIFGGFIFGRNWNFLIISLISLYAVDFVFNNFIHPEYFQDNSGLIFFDDYMIWVYLSYLLIIVMSSAILRKFSYMKLFFASIGGSILFFLITNFAWLYTTQLYPRDFGGLMASYIAALPFFRSSLLSDVVFSFFIFGLYDLVINRYFIKSNVYSLIKKQ